MALAEKSDTKIKSPGIPVFYIKDLKKLSGKITAEFYDNPSEKMQVIGVTGTNGKTLTCYYIAELLNLLNVKTAVIGTTGYGMPGNLTQIENTTPGPVELQKIFAELYDRNIKNVAMEISSHSLVQERAADIKIDAAVYTNLTQEHLDYHKNMENYVAAKKMLFSIPSIKYVSLNLDDGYGKA